MNIFEIEERLNRVLTSPLSVRLASLYVARGKLDQAFKLCFETLERSPDYATLYIVLGRCYAAIQMYDEAIFCLEKASSITPGIQLPEILITNWKSNLSKVFSSIPKYQNEIEVPFLESLKLKIKIIPEPVETTEIPEEIIQIDDGLEKINFDNLVKDLSEAKPITSNLNQVERKKEQTPNENNGSDYSQMLSPTLAEIYLKQGEYEEAIRTYKALIHQRPMQKEIFEAKIKELEEKLKF